MKKKKKHKKLEGKYKTKRGKNRSYAIKDENRDEGGPIGDGDASNTSKNKRRNSPMGKLQKRKRVGFRCICN